MLKELSDEALQAELDRRKAERDEKAKPQPIAEPDWSTVRAVAIGHVAGILRGEKARIDEKRFIYRQVLTTVYGTDIFDVLFSAGLGPEGRYIFNLIMMEGMTTDGKD